MELRETVLRQLKNRREGFSLEQPFYTDQDYFQLDMETIAKSVEKTGRCLVVMEAPRTSGFASELVTLVQERCFYHLEAPVERVTGWDTPYPHAYEWAYFPGPKRMKRALEKVMAD